MVQMIALDAVKDGKVMEQIQAAFAEVFADIQNEEKDAQHRRQVVVKFNMDPTVDRKAFKMTMEVKSTLGRHSQVGSMLFFEKKGKNLIAHDESPEQQKLE
jgi:ABC-type transporter MlaC component